ncbi:MAG: molybdopterin adenylyltransferase [Chloroflexota bacterium]
MTNFRVGILTVSDRASRGEYQDLSGPQLVRIVQETDGLVLAEVDIVPDEVEAIQQCLVNWADSGRVDLIITTGGTGFAPRDITPEATREVIDKEAPGIAEAMRWESLKITPHAMLSRGIVGIRGSSLIVNLPGSPKAARENLLSILQVLPHALELIQGRGADSHDIKQN